MGIYRDHHGVHSPSWMHTLIRRTTPHLALVRNSLSSGVTTSARNMAAQQWCPPARGGLEEPVPDIRSSQSKFGKRGCCRRVLLSGRSVLKDCWVRLCDRGLSLKQLGQYHVTGRGNPITSPKFSSQGLTVVSGWVLQRKRDLQTWKNSCWANMAPFTGVEMKTHNRSV